MSEKRIAWGKTDKEGCIHPLVHHSMDVAAVLLALMEQPVFANRLNQAAGREVAPVDRQRVAALAFLHDIGKLHPGFQAKGWPDGLWKKPKQGHTKESWDLVALAARSSQHPFHECVGEFQRWGSGWQAILLAMFSHHGRPLERPPMGELQDWDSPRLLHYDWREGAGSMVAALHRWFAPAFAQGGGTLPEAPQFHHLVAGLGAVADWIGSHTRFFPYAHPLNDGYDEIARDNARRAIEEIGLQPHPLRVAGTPGFSDVAEWAPRPAQALVGAIPIDERLVILEAETGSGKTEAALWRFAQLRAAGMVSGLYFAVPTRAAAKQLHERVHKAVKRLFGAGGPDTVLAIPGIIKAGDYEGRRLPEWKVQWDDESASATRWAAEHATRFLAAEVAVGTVDQAMLAALKARHAHLRGSVLSRSLLVIDEVHASDAFMTEILKHLVDDHLATGGFAMLMSATLGSRARARWLDSEEPPLDQACATPYPAVWTASEHSPRTTSEVHEGKVVHPEVVRTMDPNHVAAIAIQHAEAGARVLVIRNTVDYAIRTWQAVRDQGRSDLLLEAGGGPALHHSRFAAEDRRLLDAAVERELGPDPQREPARRIVIGTQTLEQSLDIDADLLVTDLCPMDVLLQRIGRLHRHTQLRRPPDYRRARVVVLAPARGLDALTKPAFENGLGAWTRDRVPHYIYGDLACLELTRRRASTDAAWRIPDTNRTLVEEATHQESITALLDELGQAWRDYDSDICGTEAARSGLARLQVLDRRDPYGEAFPSNDERVMTRLGDEGAVLDFDPVEGPFGVSISRVVLPGALVARDQPRRPGDHALCRRFMATSRRQGDVRLLTSRAGTTCKCLIIKKYSIESHVLFAPMRQGLWSCPDMVASAC